jgi:hypothetical protein
VDRQTAPAARAFGLKMRREAHMRSDFDQVKKRLEEAADLINRFPEAGTQKHVIDLLIGDEEDRDGYDQKLLEDLWAKDYKGLVLSAGRKGGRLREPRFVMEGRVARAAHRMAWVTGVLAVATAIFAAATLYVEILRCAPR